ncbi:MAG TPA: M23 family metallopeptidase [Candidatus Limnocylindrales bacterium]|nr:M23 family metallopeptidase [Candidatus Limnocylindrales bacterium]
MAYQHDVAEQASSTTSSTATRRSSRPRTLVAIAAAGLLALAVVLPAVASWPVASRSSYLSRGYSSSHRADDIAAPRGTRIVPIRSGRVVFAGWKSNCGGYQVWVGHGNGLYSAYYHMSRETSWSGRYVSRQESTLGYVGTSGCVTGSHLHVEVWKGYPWRSGSYRVNPWNYIDSGTYLPYKYR